MLEKIKENKGFEITEYQADKNTYSIVNDEFTNLISNKNNEDILVYQPDSTRSFIDLRNVVDILEKLINENVKQLNIGTNKKYTILEVAEITKKIFESSSEIKIVSKRNDEIKHRNVFTDLSKYVEDFYTLEDTLRYIKDNK